MAILDTDDAVATTSTILATLNDCTDGAAAWDVFLGNSAVAHLFRVAAGLESMVVGEREIAGQLRRALAAAQEAGMRRSR
ncbi:hypothetical protein [Tessaracoccus coleopterorum]|uniref:hypothetical protein n=1 Tax=Tessaracoccus coleopterorum TaxID=2714950 RepID=UPI001E5CE063|nr:hypothetical protein [Tessaracoccus coleopterorum]